MSFFAELKRRNVIRACAVYAAGSWLLIQIAETTFPAFGLGDGAVRLVIVTLAIGLVPAMLLAWAFEWTPEGVKRDRDVDRDPAALRQAARRADRAIMSVLALAVGFFAFDKFVLDPGRDAARERAAADRARSEALASPSRDRSIVVLPFANLSGDAEQEYFSDGITTELLHLLARMPELRVISPSSAFAYKGKDVNVKQVAEDLDVAYVLEGSVRATGDRVRITAQLVDAISDTQLWSESYDRTFDDIFAIQDSIAREVVPQLRVQIVGEVPTLPQTTPEAYRLFLQAQHAYGQRTTGGYARALELVSQALALDDEFAPNWTLLASSYINQVLTDQRPYVEGYELAIEASDRALALAPDWAFSHTTKAWIAMSYQRDYALSARHFRRARELLPNDAVVLGNSAVLARAIGHIDDAIELTRRSIELNPVSSISYANLANYLMLTGWLAEAEAAARRGMDLSPGSSYPVGMLATIQVLTERYEEAVESADGVDNQPSRLMLLSLAWYGLGNEAKSDEALQALVRDHADQWAWYVAVCYAWRGDSDAAFEWLDRAIDESQTTYGVNTNRFLRPLHGDDRWEPMLERIGLSARQLAAIDF